MQTETITNVRYPKSRKRFFTNFVISLWFEERLKEVKKEGNAKRIKKYSQMDPFEMVLEPPLIFKNSEKKFESCIVDRQAGILLVDQKIPQVDFLTFLKLSTKSENINLSGDYNKETIELAKKGITTDDILAIINDPSKISKDPIYHLTKEYGTENFIIIYDNAEEDPDFDLMVSWIFNDYVFEHIKMNVMEEGDDGYSTGEGTKLSDFYGGNILLEDKIMVEQSINFNLINLKAIVSNKK